MIQHFTFTVREHQISPDGLYISDITDEIVNHLMQSKITNGITVIQSLHTTMALAVNENEPGLMRCDFPQLLRQLAPCENRGPYQHDDLTTRTENLDPDEPERQNGHSHCRALLLNHSVQIIIKDGNLHLGKWQRILLIELDGNGRKNRQIALMFMGES